MRRTVASVAMISMLIGVSAPAAHAGGSTDAALGLASFAVFNQLIGPLLFQHRAAVVRREVVYQPVVHHPPAPPPAVVYAPVPAYPTVVQYPHGRYELRLHGPQYVWVWIPAVPPPPPPPAP